MAIKTTSSRVTVTTTRYAVVIELPDSPDRVWVDYETLNEAILGCLAHHINDLRTENLNRRYGIWDRWLDQWTRPDCLSHLPMIR